LGPTAASPAAHAEEAQASAAITAKARKHPAIGERYVELIRALRRNESDVTIGPRQRPNDGYARALVFTPPSVTEDVCHRGTCDPARVKGTPVSGTVVKET
jgi:hypothetical protein